MIKGEDIAAPSWQQHFRTAGVEIELLAPPEVEALSRYEIRKLKNIHRQYENVDTWAIVEETHKFPEWVKNYPDPEENTSRPIQFEDTCEAVGLACEIEQIRQDLHEACAIDRLFG